MKIKGYIKMSYSVIYNAEISDGAKLLLGHFSSMAERFNDKFFAQPKILSTTFGKSVNEINAIITELCTKGYLVNKLMNGKCYLSINYDKLANAPQTSWRKSDRDNISKIGKVKVAASAIDEKTNKDSKNCINIQNTEEQNKTEKEEKAEDISNRTAVVDFFSIEWKEKDYEFFRKYCPNTHVTDEMYANVMTMSKRIYDKCLIINQEKINGDTNSIYCDIDSEEMKKSPIQNYLMFLENRGLLNYECFWRNGVKYVGFSNFKTIEEFLKEKNQVKDISNRTAVESPVDDVNSIISINWDKVYEEERQLIIDGNMRNLLWRIRTNFKKNNRKAMEYSSYVVEHKISAAEKDMMTTLKNMELLKVWKNEYDGKYYFKPIYTRYIREMSQNKQM